MPMVEELTRLTDRAQQNERQLEGFDFDNFVTDLEECVEALALCYDYIE